MVVQFDLPGVRRHSLAFATLRGLCQSGTERLRAPSPDLRLVDPQSSPTIPSASACVQMGRPQALSCPPRPPGDAPVRSLGCQKRLSPVVWGASYEAGSRAAEGRRSGPLRPPVGGNFSAQNERAPAAGRGLPAAGRPCFNRVRSSQPSAYRVRDPPLVKGGTASRAGYSQRRPKRRLRAARPARSRPSALAKVTEGERACIRAVLTVA